SVSEQIMRMPDVSVYPNKADNPESNDGTLVGGDNGTINEDNLPVSVDKQIVTDTVQAKTGDESVKPKDSPLNQTLDEVNHAVNGDDNKVLDQSKKEEDKEQTDKPKEPDNLQKNGAAPPPNAGGGSIPANTGDQAPKTNLEGVVTNLATLKSTPIQFNQPNTAKLPQNQALELFSNHRLATEAANSFLNYGSGQVSSLIQRARTVSSNLIASANTAKQTIRNKVSEEVNRIGSSIILLKSGVLQNSVNAISSIRNDFIAQESVIKSRAVTSRQKVNTEYQTELAKIDGKMAAQYPVIDSIYIKGVEALKQTGIDVGQQAENKQIADADAMMDGVEKVDDNFLDGPFTYNKLKARSDAKKAVGKGYNESFVNAGMEQADKLLKGPGKENDYDTVKNLGESAKDALLNHHRVSIDGINTAEKQALDKLKETRDSLIKTAEEAKNKTLDLLTQQNSAQTAMLHAFGNRQIAAIDRDLQKAVDGIKTGIVTAAQNLINELSQFKNSMNGTESPDATDLGNMLFGSKETLISTISQVNNNANLAIQSARNSLVNGGTQAAQGVKNLNDTGISDSNDIGNEFSIIATNLKNNAKDAYKTLESNHQQANTSTIEASLNAFKEMSKGTDDLFVNLLNNLEEGLKSTNESFKTALLDSMNTQMPETSKDEEDKAEAKVQPRWKKVVKFLVVLIVAVAIALVLGPLVIGFISGAAMALGASSTAALFISSILGGAIVGAISGAAGQIVGNLIDGKKWYQDLGQAVIAGAIGGAIGGLGGALGKALTETATTVLVPALTRFGFDFVFDFGGNLLGDLIAGKPITWDSVLLGLAISFTSSFLGNVGSLKPRRVDVDVDGPSVRADSGPSGLEGIGHRLGTRFGNRIKSGFRGAGDVTPTNVSGTSQATNTDVVTQADAVETTRISDSAETTQNPDTDSITQNLDTESMPVNDSVETTNQVDATENTRISDDVDATNKVDETTVTDQYTQTDKDIEDTNARSNVNDVDTETKVDENTVSDKADTETRVEETSNTTDTNTQGSKTTSKRLEYMGRTPGKKSRTGQEVIERMRVDGTVKTERGRTLFQSKQDSQWYDISLADMSHKVDAVTWWNDIGRFFGPKSKEVRAWMLDSSNYYLEHFSYNRSQGARLGINYQDPP
ncbi:MAG: HNH/ENDO VII family nuclease, partial [Proteobacteria bacterium]|nr:HNH/ENDO VII family nuclease [Pseudomonadota bacterium]